MGQRKTPYPGVLDSFRSKDRTVGGAGGAVAQLPR